MGSADGADARHASTLSGIAHVPAVDTSTVGG